MRTAVTLLTIALVMSVALNIWLWQKSLATPRGDLPLGSPGESEPQSLTSSALTQPRYPALPNMRLAQTSQRKSPDAASETIDYDALAQWLEQGELQYFEPRLLALLRQYPDDPELLDLEARWYIATRPLSEALLHSYDLLERPLPDEIRSRIDERVDTLEKNALKELVNSGNWDLLAEFVEPLFQRFPQREDLILLLAESYAHQQKAVLTEDTLAALPSDIAGAERIRRLLISGQQSVDEQETSLPSQVRASGERIALYQRNGQYVVPLTVVNRPMQLLLDTGASTSVIKSSVFQALNARSRAEFIGMFDVNTAGGQIRALMVQLPAVTLGPYALENVNFLIVPDQEFNGADGLLGMNILRRFHFQLDQPSATLILTPANSL